MEVQSPCSDIISTLPQGLVAHILTLMPIQDALRTSILSSKWRYYWASIPKLEFDDMLFKISSDHNAELQKSKFVNAILHVLALHKGPILEFSLYVDEFDIASELDQIISYLSRSNNLKEFSFVTTTTSGKLPSSFFLLQGLEFLNLENCNLEPPSTFNGFRWLRSLFFVDVQITTKSLQRFLSGCPLLENVFLVGGYESDFEGGDKITVVELSQYLPYIEYLQLSKYYMKYLAAGGMRHDKLPSSLVHLRDLYLDACILEQDELTCVLSMIRSSPYLVKLTIELYDYNKLNGPRTSKNFLDLQDYPDLRLDHLKELEIVKFSNRALEMEFVKLIMAKSRVLKQVQIELTDKVSANELKMCKDFMRQPFPCASPSINFNIRRPKNFP